LRQGELQLLALNKAHSIGWGAGKAVLIFVPGHFRRDLKKKKIGHKGGLGRACEDVRDG